VRDRSDLDMIKAAMRDDAKKSITSTNAISSCGPAMLCELLLLLPLAWRLQRVKGSKEDYSCGTLAVHLDLPAEVIAAATLRH